MTVSDDKSISINKKDTASGKLRVLISVILLGAAILLGIFASGIMSEYVLDGMELAVRCVLPSSFPFMILSDIYISYGHPERIRLLGDAAKKIFGIPDDAIAPLVTGNICGFPIGAKGTAELYLSGRIDKDCAERLLALSSNPSIAFVTGAVGLGMYGDLRYGLILLLALYSATAVCGMISKRKSKNKDNTVYIQRQNYNSVNSVKGAAISCVYLIAFISCFSALVGIIKKYVRSQAIVYTVSMLLEVTNAVRISANISDPLTVYSMAMSGFALGFGGISVMMQSTVFTSDTDLGYKKYIILKLTQGLIASLFSVIGYYVVF